MWHKLTDQSIKNFHDSKYFNEELLRDFISANGFTRYSFFSTERDYKKYLESGRATCGYRHEPEALPYVDHARSFKDTKSGKVCITYQPYQNPSDIEAEVKHWATRHGLETEVYDKSHSWYYPDEFGTCLVIVHLPGVEIELK